MILAGTVFAGLGTTYAEQKTGRGCTAADLLGTWDMVGMNSRVTSKDNKDPFLWPYQHFSFDAKGHVKQMSLEHSILSDKAALQKFENTLSTTRYSVNGQGLLSFARFESPNPEKCFCTYVTQDFPASVTAKVPESKKALLPRKGDVVLSYLDKDRKPLLSKTLRKSSQN